MTEKPERDLDTLGGRLAHARSLVPDLSAAELGRLAGISASLPGAIERGDTTDPLVSTVLALANALDISSSWLVHRAGRAPVGTHTKAAIARLRALQPPPGRSGPKPRVAQ